MISHFGTLMRASQAGPVGCLTAGERDTLPAVVGVQVCEGVKIGTPGLSCAIWDGTTCVAERPSVVPVAHSLNSQEGK